MSAQAKQYIIDTATVYYGNIDTTQVDTLITSLVGKELGISKGGIKIEAKPEVRKVEHDGGLDRNIKGMSRITKWDIKGEGSILEYNPKLLEASLMKKDSTISSTKYDVYIPQNDLEVGDYQSLVIVGKLHGSDTPCIFIIDNTFNMEGISVDTKDNDEGAFKMAFEGYYESNESNPPFKILTKKSV